ncbi:hypothetical protein UFOVP325_109 [uncultured Caudovirales phage]|uniref:Uncharacterized protein n=1 Tax=uncultured Caudovirales phage TaxID=2100421 RepID=A0A6J5MMS6_9CAUD|nr:hypothetical protein UFOVP325_109 [uncultured Caudovirales phage]CAB4148104.1 hypothetical protein UFOVP430_104 [uncultured Caudovirales phage]
MGIYNTFDWGDGTLYGDASKVAYSAAPLKATAIGSTTYVEEFIESVVNGTPVMGNREVVRPKVELHWNTPTGSVFGFRLVRNQDGFSEHEEDGQVILETFTPVVPAETNFTDEFDSAPLIEGRYAYYTVWLLLADFTWVIGAYTYCLVPKEHSVRTPEGNLYKTSERKFIESLPKVYTTQMQSYLDEVSESSDLRTFMGGFSYTLDEILTFADLLMPDFSGNTLNPNMVDLQAQQLGLPKEPTLNIQRKKALIRNAFYLNKYRGSLDSVELLVKSLSGFLTQTYLSPNLLLSIQDSSFYKGVGNWKIAANGTLTANLTTGATDLPVQTEVYSVDRSYTGKVITSASNVVMSLGTEDPRFTGIPVDAGIEHQLSYYVKGSSNNVTPYIKWYDQYGVIIGSAVAGTASSAGSTWSKKTLVATSPDNASFAAIELSFSTASTYYVDFVQLSTTSDSRYTDYYEARSVDIRLSPTKVNYIKNPSMSSATSWSLTDATGVYTNNSTLPGIKLDGTKMSTITTTASTSFFLSTSTDTIISPGKYYTFSIYANLASGTQNVNIKLEAIDSNGDILTSINGDLSLRTLTNQTLGTAWQRFSVPVFVYDTADVAYLKATIYGTGTGAVINLDAAQIEEGYGSSDYFEGSYTNRGAYWTGTANNSISVLYRNKAPKINRMIFEIPNYLPMNTAYTITSGFNGATVLETSGFSS